MKLIIEEPSGISRHNWPVTRGIPFKMGELHTADCLGLINNSGQHIPVQTKTLSYWPDRSIKWLQAFFQVDLPAQSVDTYTLVNNDKPALLIHDNPIKIVENNGLFEIDTGNIVVNIDLRSGFRVFNQVKRGNRTIVSENGCWGFNIIDSQGIHYSSMLGQVSHSIWEETGPLRAVLFVSGDHRSQEGTRLFAYEARLTFYAGLNWCELEYTFINDHDNDHTALQQVSFSISPNFSENTTGLVGAFQQKFESDQPFLIHADEPASSSFFTGTKIYDFDGNLFEFDQPGEMLRRVAHGWMDISDKTHGVMICVKNLTLMAPKAISYDTDRIEMQLWPARSSMLHLPQGMARTHRMMVLFHNDSGSKAEVNKFATCYEINLCPSIAFENDPINLFGPVFDYRPKKYPEINIRLRDQFNYFLSSSLGTGFFNYGDSDQGLVGQRAGYQSNNEYDLPLSLALQFLRTGEQEYFDALNATVFHMMDIDFVHHSSGNPLETGGVRIHGINHIQQNCEGMPGFTIATSHMWTEGLLAYYLLTGHPTALARAKSIGNCLLRMIEAGWAIPPYKVAWHGVRDSAWPIIAFAGLYEVTGEQCWMDALIKLADIIVDTQHNDGGWDMKIGWYKATKVPLQTGIGMNGLCRAHAITGDERYLNAAIEAGKKLKESTFPEGNFLYIDAPGYRWNYTSTVVLESLGYLWKHTEDLTYLELALRNVQACLATKQVNGTGLAYSWRYLLRYLYWAEEAKFLKDEV